MKHLVNLILTIAIFEIISCEGNNTGLHDKNNNLTSLDTFILNHYEQDAKFLYFHELITDSNHLDFNNPVMDTTEITNILKIIQAVYKLKSPESDTVFNYYEIHGHYCYSFNSINLKVKTEMPEIKKLSQKIIPTGEKELDNLLSIYHFDSVRTYYSYPNFPWLTIYTKYEYNMIPLEKEFNELPQIIIAEFSKGCVGDGMNISLSRNNDSATIIFSIGSGDCPAGCIYHKYWEFKVTNEKAEFVKTYEN